MYSKGDVLGNKYTISKCDQYNIPSCKMANENFYRGSTDISKKKIIVTDKKQIESINHG